PVASPGRIALVEPDGGRTQELVPFPAVAAVPEHVEAFGERAEVELARPVGRRRVEHGPRLARERAAVAVELLVGPPVAGREGEIGGRARVAAGRGAREQREEQAEEPGRRRSHRKARLPPVALTTIAQFASTTRAPR